MLKAEQSADSTGSTAKITEQSVNRGGAPSVEHGAIRERCERRVPGAKQFAMAMRQVLSTEISVVNTGRSASNAAISVSGQESQASRTEKSVNGASVQCRARRYPSPARNAKC